MTVQIFFSKGLHEISLNAQIMLLFKSCRDANQIARLLRQIYLKMYKNALEAFKDGVSLERGYLVIDFCCEKHDNQRLPSGIFQKIRNFFINKSLVFASKSPRTFALILDKASSQSIRCLCECAHNVLQGNVSLSHHHKKN